MQGANSKSAQHLYTVGTVVLQSTDVFTSSFLLRQKCADIRGEKKSYMQSVSHNHAPVPSLLDIIEVVILPSQVAGNITEKAVKY